MQKIGNVVNAMEVVVEVVEECVACTAAKITVQRRWDPESRMFDGAPSACPLPTFYLMFVLILRPRARKYTLKYSSCFSRQFTQKFKYPRRWLLKESASYWQGKSDAFALRSETLCRS